MTMEGGRIDGEIYGYGSEVYLNGMVGKRVDIEADQVRFGVDYRANQGTKLTLQNDSDRKKIKNVPEDLEIIIEEKRAFYESAFFYWSLIAMFTVGVLL